MIAVKKTFFSTTMMSAESHPTQLFKVIHDLITPKSDPTSDENLVPSYDVFGRHFVNKISLIHSNLEASLSADLVSDMSELSANKVYLFIYF